MSYTLSDLADVLFALKSRNVRGAIIGSTVVDLALRRREFEDDVDLFVLEPSPLIEEEFYRSLAEDLGWDLSYTVLGTPKLVAKRGDIEIIVELYENIHDFFVPLEIIEAAPYKNLGGVETKVIRPEDYVVLKARAGRASDMEDLRVLREYVEEGKLQVDERMLLDRVKLFDEEDQKFILDKLRDLGFIR
ncbi:MAG: nucleotidyltransferase [Thermoproteota archaeon]